MITKPDSFLFLAFFIFIVLALVLVFFWIFSTEKRLKKFFLGKKAKDLEEVINKLQTDISDLQKSKESIQKEIIVMNGKLSKSIRGLHIMRFNPFSDQGSNQSFAIGMLDEQGDGLVLSSLYSRDRMSVFAKPVKNGSSDYELSAEEKEALRKAEVK